MILLVDSVDVEPPDTDAYLDAFARLYLPGAKARGMELVACWHTPRDIGEDVTVTVVFRLDGWAAWEQARNAAVGDPSMPQWIEARRALMKRGTRRFAEPASFSPLQ
jgi:hypothetical protein